jgi:hypothetical protein
MKINIPKLTQPLDLGEYAEELRGQIIRVWVNPPLKTRLERIHLSKRFREIGDEMLTLPAEATEQMAALDAEAQEMMQQVDELNAEMWSQGPEETRFTAEEVRKFREDVIGTDPELVPWIIGRSVDMMLEHLGAVKKVSTPPARS